MENKLKQKIEKIIFEQEDESKEEKTVEIKNLMKSLSDILFEK